MIVITDPKNFDFDFDWPKNIDETLKHGIEFIIKRNESLAENKIKNETEQLLLKYKHGNNIHEHGKSKTNEMQKFALNLSQRLEFISPNKHVAFQKLSIYYTWKNIRKQCKNSKLEIIAPPMNHEFELPGSYSDLNIQDYIEYIIKKHKIVTTICLIHVYTNRINNRLVFKITNTR